MTVQLVPLTKALARSAFDCGYPELNQFLRQFAVKNDQLSISKTFIALAETGEIAGYFSVCTAQIRAEVLPEELRAKLPRYPVPAFRIGKLAVDLRFQGAGVGRYLLAQALQKALDISNRVGLYTVIVDSIDEKAKGFYMKYGFVPFAEHPLTLFLPLATVRVAANQATEK